MWIFYRFFQGYGSHNYRSFEEHFQESLKEYGSKKEKKKKIIKTKKKKNNVPVVDFLKSYFQGHFLKVFFFKDFHESTEDIFQ